jgi:hypothetical protein
MLLPPSKAVVEGIVETRSLIAEMLDEWRSATFITSIEFPH